MRLNELHPSKYLSADDLDADAVVTIASLAFEKMKNQEGKEEQKPVMYFRNVEKGIVLNKTNATRIGEIHGDETDNWVGKKITLTKEWVEAFGKADWAIRVKVQPPPGKATGALKNLPAEPDAPAGDPADSFGGSGN